MRVIADLSSEQWAAREAFEILLANEAQADCIYDSLPDSKGGRIISTDIARYLDQRYRDTREGKPRDLLPGWDCAWRYAHGRLTRELRNRKTRQMVRFMAGGWAAGKTHALEHANPPDLAWDGTLGDPEWALEKVDFALHHGWRVDIAYVYRDIEIALYGAVERALKEGRSVPLDELASNHRAVQRSILHLLERYHSHPEVNFTLVHNTGVDGIKGKALAISYDDLALRGPLHYTEAYESYYSKAALEIENLNPAQG